MYKPKVLIITKVHDVLLDALRDHGYDIVQDFNVGMREMPEIIDAFEGIVTSTKIKFDKRLLDCAPKLKWIARMGSGMEHIDVAVASSKQILCISSPDGNANSVAEQALGMFLALEHNVFKSDKELQSEIWLRDENRGREIEGSTAGIIGMGHNGGLFAKKLACLGVKVLGFDPYRDDYEGDNIKNAVKIEEIFEHCTMVIFHVPYNSETHHYFDESFLAGMKHDFTLLNLSRGEVANQRAVLKGMQSGKVRAAALDVWEKEPLFLEPPNEITKQLLAFPNFIGTAHIGGYSHESIYKMSLSLKNKLQRQIWDN